MMKDTPTSHQFDLVIADPTGRYTDELVASLATHSFGSETKWRWFTHQMAAQVLAVPEAERADAINRLYNRKLEEAQPAYERDQRIWRMLFWGTMTFAVILIGATNFPHLVNWVGSVLSTQGVAGR
jgi:hypothetical protein